MSTEISSRVGKWGCTYDEELYHGSFATPDEAAAQGATEHGEAVTVGQYCNPLPPEKCIDASCLLEQVWQHDDYSGDWGEGEVSPTGEQVSELTAAVARVMAEWLDRHGLRPTFLLVDPDTVRRITVPQTGG